MVFDVEDVRFLARQFGWNEVQFNTQSRVLGFVRHNKERINVYYTTGTVGTCTDHPRLGKTQLFRREVEYHVLEEIFSNIRTHTGRGYYQKVDANGRSDPVLPSSNINWWCTTDDGMEDLVEDNSKYSPSDYPIMVLGESWLGIDGEGRPYWGPGIPKLLDNKLRGRQRWLPTVDVVCLGPDRFTYFVQFADGKSEWAGLPEELEESILDTNSSVKSIALGDVRRIEISKDFTRCDVVHPGSPRFFTEEAVCLVTDHDEPVGHAYFSTEFHDVNRDTLRIRAGW